MAEIKCPMCGKANDDSLDVCEFCDARLKPLLASDSDSVQEPYWVDSGEEKVDESAPLEQGDEEIDADAIELLRDLSSELDEDLTDDEETALPFVIDEEDVNDAEDEDDPEKTRKLAESQAEGKISDWLKDKLDSAEAPVKGFDEDSPGSEFIRSDEKTVKLGEDEDDPDWLAEIESGDVDSTDELIAAFINENGELAVEAEVPDWLASMEDETPDTDDETPETEDAGIETEEDSEDWLAALREGDDAPKEEEEADEGETAEPAEVPEWLASIQ